MSEGDGWRTLGRRGGEGHVKCAKGFKREVTPFDLHINVSFL